MGDIAGSGGIRTDGHAGASSSGPASLGPSPHAGEPLATFLGFAAALLSGATDVTGLGRLGDMNAGYMSGNTVALGSALAVGAYGRAGAAAGVIGCFVVASGLAALLGDAAGRWRAPVLLGAAAFLLSLPPLVPVLAVPGLVGAMGMLNAVLSPAPGVTAGVTYVTGTLMRIGQGAARALAGRGDRQWLALVPVWCGLLAGAAGAALLPLDRPGGYWPLPAGCALLVVIAAVAGRR